MSYRSGSQGEERPGNAVTQIDRALYWLTATRPLRGPVGERVRRSRCSRHLLHLVRDHQALDLLVGRHRDDLLLVQFVLRLVGPARDDLLRVRVADALREITPWQTRLRDEDDRVQETPIGQLCG